MSSARLKEPLLLEAIQQLPEYHKLSEKQKKTITEIYTELNNLNCEKLVEDNAKSPNPAFAINITRGMYKNRVDTNIIEIIKKGILGYIDAFFNEITTSAIASRNKSTQPATTAAATTLILKSATHSANTAVSTAARTAAHSNKQPGKITDHVVFLNMTNALLAKLNDIAAFAKDYIDFIKDCKESKTDPAKLKLMKELLDNITNKYETIKSSDIDITKKTDAAVDFYKLLNKAADQKCFKVGLFSDSYKTVDTKAFAGMRKNKTLSIRHVIAKYMTQGDYLKLRNLVKEAAELHEGTKPTFTAAKK